MGRSEFAGDVQGPPRTAIRLSCCEIRHLFWELVLVVERSTQAVLHWSKWRRWHQAWAGYYHTRRRERTRVDWTAQQPDVQQEATHEEEVQQPDVMDVVWKRLERLLPADGRTGRPYEAAYARRVSSLANRLRAIRSLA